MKTKELGRFFITLSDLNNSFTHYTFVWNQFLIDYSEQLKNNSKEMTKSYFNENLFSVKHNILFEKLDEEHIKTNRTLVEGIFLLVYSHFESYLKNVFYFAQQIDNSIINLEENLENVESDFMLLDKILNRINIDKTSFYNELLITLDYLRLKRNRLIHQNSENISNSLNKIINKEGGKLNKYWNRTLSKQLQGIDFKSKANANSLEFSIIIDLLNILRIVSKEIDEKIIQALSIDKIVSKLIIPEFLITQEHKLKNYKSEKVINKFRKYCQCQYSFVIDNKIADTLLGSIV